MNLIKNSKRTATPVPLSDSTVSFVDAGVNNGKANTAKKRELQPEILIVDDESSDADTEKDGLICLDFGEDEDFVQKKKIKK